MHQAAVCGTNDTAERASNTGGTAQVRASDDGVAKEVVVLVLSGYAVIDALRPPPPVGAQARAARCFPQSRVAAAAPVPALWRGPRIVRSYLGMCCLLHLQTRVVTNRFVMVKGRLTVALAPAQRLHAGS